MITYSVYYAKMQSFETAVNTVSLESSVPVSTSGMSSQEAVLCQMGRFVQLVSTVHNVIGSDEFWADICQAMSVIIRLMRPSANYCISDFSPEEVTDDEEGELLSNWENQIVKDYSCMTTTLLAGQVLLASNIVGPLEPCNSSEVVYWCYAQLDNIARFCIMHDLDIAGAMKQQMGISDHQ